MTSEIEGFKDVNQVSTRWAACHNRSKHLVPHVSDVAS